MRRAWTQVAKLKELVRSLEEQIDRQDSMIVRLQDGEVASLLHLQRDMHAQCCSCNGTCTHTQHALSPARYPPLPSLCLLSPSVIMPPSLTHAIPHSLPPSPPSPSPPPSPLAHPSPPSSLSTLSAPAVIAQEAAMRRADDALARAETAENDAEDAEDSLYLVCVCVCVCVCVYCGTRARQFLASLCVTGLYSAAAAALPSSCGVRPDVGWCSHECLHANVIVRAHVHSARVATCQARKEVAKKEEQLQEKNEQIDVLLSTAERQSSELEGQRSEITLLRRDIAAAVCHFCHT